jgi:hypothetical protein
MSIGRTCTNFVQQTCVVYLSVDMHKSLILTDEIINDSWVIPSRVERSQQGALEWIRSVYTVSYNLQVLLRGVRTYSSICYTLNEVLIQDRWLYDVHKYGMLTTHTYIHIYIYIYLAIILMFTFGSFHALHEFSSVYYGTCIYGSMSPWVLSDTWVLSGLWKVP